VLGLSIAPRGLVGSLACWTALALGPACVAALAPVLQHAPVHDSRNGTEAEAAIRVPKLQPEVTRSELEAHVRWLASDELAGRMTGTEEAVLAARYLAEVLAKSGVEPAGDDGGFLQKVPLIRSRSMALPELSLELASAEAPPPPSGGGSAGTVASIVAVFGEDFEISRGALDRSRLRVLVVRSAEEIPKDRDRDLALFLDTGRGPARSWLEEAGHPDGDGFGLLVLAGSTRAGEPKRAPPRGDSYSVDASQRDETVRVTVRGALLERFRRGEVASLSLRTNVISESLAAFNVVGRLRGAGLEGQPELAEEAVVVSAHYDHLGHEPGPPAPEPAGTPVVDRIYNGADDDASGCAAVLEVAGALAAGPKPARTVIFLLATGEEIGLLGTKHYLEHPAVPLARTIANLNVEMIGRPDALVGGAGKLWLTGFERTDLGPACAAAGLDVVADRRPEEHFFERSDNIAFVIRGIVGQTFSTYDLHQDYHHVTDEADRLDYAHMESCTRSILSAIRLVTDGSLRPRWVEGFEPKSRSVR
jgi:hypothetical protein